MKKYLKYIDLIFLRLIPLAYFVVSIYASLSFSLPMWGGEFGVLDVMTGSIIISFCFLFLGSASVFRRFASTVKVANICKYIASGVAVVYILGYTIRLIWFLSWGVAPAFFGSVIEWQDEFHVVALVLLIVCCYLKDDFYKLKWGLTVSCVIMFFVASVLPMVSLMMYHDPVAWRLLSQTIVFVCCCGAIAFCSLYPQKGVPVQSEEQSMVDFEKEWEEKWAAVLKQGDDPATALDLCLLALEEHPCNGKFLYRAAVAEERLAELEDEETEKQKHLRMAFRYANRLDDFDDDQTITRLLARLRSKMGS